MLLSKLTRIRGILTVLAVGSLVLVLVFSSQASAGAWTNPSGLAQGARHYGFQSSLMGDSLLVVTTVSQTGDKVVINADEFTLDGGLVRKSALQVEAQGLIGYSLTSSSNQYIIVWAEVLDATCRLYMQSSEDVEKLLLKETDSHINSVTAAVDAMDRLAISWTDNSQGLQGVYVHLRNLDTGVTLADLQLSPPGQLYLDPVVAWSGNVLHVIYKEHDQIFTNIIHRAVALGSMEISDPLGIRRTNLETFEMPFCTAVPQGRLDVVWPADVQSRALTRGSVLMRATISGDGLWVEEPSEFARFVGSTGSVTRATAESGQALFVFANNQSGSFQVYSMLSDSTPNLVTYGTRHRFAPQTYYVNGATYVLFSEVGEDHIEIFLVRHVAGSPLPLALRLGLDPEAPLLDAIFKGTTILISAAVLAFLALGSIMGAAWASANLYRASATVTPSWNVIGAHIMVYAILAILKRYGGFLYYGAVFVPGLSGALISLGSVIFALGIITMLQLDRLDVFTLGVSGYMWAFADAFCSIYVRGAGLW